jgi:hypothetical protein
MKLSSALMIALALTSAVAATLTVSASAQDKITAVHASALPLSTCPIDDPTVCGLVGPSPDGTGRSITIGD